MAKKVSITRELIRATNISRRRKSKTEQAFMNRIVIEVGGLSEDIRASLSPEAQAWYASAVEAINQGDVIPSPVVCQLRRMASQYQLRIVPQLSSNRDRKALRTTHSSGQNQRT